MKGVEKAINNMNKDERHYDNDSWDITIWNKFNRVTRNVEKNIPSILMIPFYGNGWSWHYVNVVGTAKIKVKKRRRWGWFSWTNYETYNFYIVDDNSGGTSTWIDSDMVSENLNYLT